MYYRNERITLKVPYGIPHSCNMKKGKTFYVLVKGLFFHDFGNGHNKEYALQKGKLR